MEEKLSLLLTNAVNSCNALYKEGHVEIENSRIRGKKDIFEETLKWMIKSNEGDLKFVRIDHLLQHLKCQIHPDPQIPSFMYTSKKYKTSVDN
ncbi:hypothetical protein SteCoe_2170 [Stentor coeruleus]|uniref:Uncharacterized protein n=1 Tax=Stentor coeruleus TaxID=5963 RepID=A0A1R2D0B7_9CILI|nr:hypothetical protein SteCoe_2170 [Stentor coeruleus]